MILYVNGDSHSVGHGINTEFGMTHEDLRYEPIKNAPHPSNFSQSFGYQVAQNLQLPLVCQAVSGGSIERCLRTTKQFLFQTNFKVFVLLGLPSLNREEWYYQNKWWQITVGESKRYPTELQIRFKEWLVYQDTESYKQQRVTVVEKKIVNFQNWLKEKNVPNIIFSTADNIPILEFPVYTEWLISNDRIPDQWNHFKSDGHTAWANYLTPKINDIICKWR